MFLPWRIALRRRVIVNLVDGSGVSGVLFAKRGPLLVLKEASFLEVGVEPVPVDGDVIVERPKVLYIQAL